MLPFVSRLIPTVFFVVVLELLPTESFQTSVNIHQSTERNNPVNALLSHLRITFCVLSCSLLFIRPLFISRQKIKQTVYVWRCTITERVSESKIMTSVEKGNSYRTVTIMEHPEIHFNWAIDRLWSTVEILGFCRFCEPQNSAGTWRQAWLWRATVTLPRMRCRDKRG